jgi:hypothetical protein
MRFETTSSADDRHCIAVAPRYPQPSIWVQSRSDEHHRISRVGRNDALFSEALPSQERGSGFVQGAAAGPGRRRKYADRKAMPALLEAMAAGYIIPFPLLRENWESIATVRDEAKHQAAEDALAANRHVYKQAHGANASGAKPGTFDSGVDRLGRARLRPHLASRSCQPKRFWELG